MEGVSGCSGNQEVFGINRWVFFLSDWWRDVDVDEFTSFTEHSIVNHKIIEVKVNFIPKGLVPLERLFLKDDTLEKPIVQSSEENVSSCNIGTESQPKIIKISKLLS